MILKGQRIHCRVLGYTHPSITLANEGTIQAGSIVNTHSSQTAATNGSSSVYNFETETSTSFEVEIIFYDKNFDDFTEAEKCESMVGLLEVTPSVKEMSNYLKQGNRSEARLQDWLTRLSPAALGVLRWIIASNRSCIVQVDYGPGQDEDDGACVRQDQKVTNMDGWVQFRFAQGSPDKEQRFHQQLHNSAAKKHPTIFAWHGSPFANWHSIIRQGLDFKEILAGRAYGNGVYHALDLSTSMGYATAAQDFWPGSELRPSTAVSMNEIVNATEKFTSRNPYLVVSQVDWIQCRYLFVSSGFTGQSKISSKDAKASLMPGVQHIEQETAFHLMSTNGQVVDIPNTAFPASRNLVIKSTGKAGNKSQGGGHKKARKEAVLDSSEVSNDDSDPEDLEFLRDKDLDEIVETGGDGNTHMLDLQLSDRPVDQKENIPIGFVYDASKTSFIPNSLDFNSLPMLQEPDYSNPGAAKALAREFKNVLKTQQSVPQHELGWYIDGNNTPNLYQWIVELHSFDETLPLARDMVVKGVKSIVCELRFPKDYPMSPPFVRIIRPRFLPFVSGGGGHVTGGGSMCMELLTDSGWSPASSIEGVLLQIRLALSNLQPYPARLQGEGDYGTDEAMKGFMRAAGTHGWRVPKHFNEFAVAAKK